jgi:hypothetical protein
MLGFKGALSKPFGQGGGQSHHFKVEHCASEAPCSVSLLMKIDEVDKLIISVIIKEKRLPKRNKRESGDRKYSSCVVSRIVYPSTALIMFQQACS